MSDICSSFNFIPKNFIWKGNSGKFPPLFWYTPCSKDFLSFSAHVEVLFLDEFLCRALIASSNLIDCHEVFWEFGIKKVRESKNTVKSILFYLRLHHLSHVAQTSNSLNIQLFYIGFLKWVDILAQPVLVLPQLIWLLGEHS